MVQNNIIETNSPEEEYRLLLQDASLIYDQSFRHRFGVRRKQIFLYHGVKVYVIHQNGELTQINGVNIVKNKYSL